MRRKSISASAAWCANSPMFCQARPLPACFDQLGVGDAKRVLGWRRGCGSRAVPTALPPLPTSDDRSRNRLWQIAQLIVASCHTPSRRPQPMEEHASDVVSTNQPIGAMPPEARVPYPKLANSARGRMPSRTGFAPKPSSGRWKMSRTTKDLRQLSSPTSTPRLLSNANWCCVWYNYYGASAARHRSIPEIFRIQAEILHERRYNQSLTYLRLGAAHISGFDNIEEGHEDSISASGGPETARSTTPAQHPTRDLAHCFQRLVNLDSRPSNISGAPSGLFRANLPKRCFFFARKNGAGAVVMRESATFLLKIAGSRPRFGRYRLRRNSCFTKGARLL